MKIRYIYLLVLLFGCLFSYGQIHEPVREEWMSKEDYIVMLIDSLAFAEAEKDSLDVIRFASALTTSMHGSRMRERAKSYAGVALEYSMNFSETQWYADVCNRMGMLLFSLRRISPLDTNQYIQICDSSLFWHNRAIEFGQKFENLTTQGWGRRGAMSVLIDLDELMLRESSNHIQEHYQRIVEIVNQTGDEDLFIHSSHRFASHLLVNKKWEELEIVIEKLQPHLERMKEGKRLAFYNMVHDYIAVKNDLDTLRSIRKLLSIELDKIMAADHSGKLHEMDQKYEVSKTKDFLDSTQEQLTKSKNVLIVIIFIAVSILMVLFYFYQLNRRNKRLSQRNKLLLKEQNHRVKNNLQMINSLLSLQSQKLLSTDAKEALNESQLRINSVALLHRMLYEEKQAGTVNILPYLNTLTEEISYAVSRNINIKIEVLEDLQLSIEKTTSLGLIINELLTNSIKHVEESTDLLVHISLNKPTDKELVLNYKDNGRGISLDVWNTSTSFGNQLIRLQSEQLRGKYSVNGEKGFQYELRIGA